MDFNLNNLFDISKLPAKIFFFLAISSALILFIPAEYLDKLRINNQINDYRWIVWLFFVSSTSMCFLNFCIWLYNKIYVFIKVGQIKKEFKRLLKNLDDDEKSVLREFYLGNKNTIEVPFDHPVVTKMINDRIIRVNKQFSNGFIMNGNFVSVSLNKYAEKSLQLKDINLREDMSEDELSEFLNRRPSWVNNRLR